jgi:DNA polymerase-3 subunit delta'
MAESKGQFKWPPIGQERAADFLEKSLLSGKLAQTYIFAGCRDLGKASLALAFARNLWRQDRGQGEGDDNFESLNSDLYILEKELDKKQIGVEQAREFTKNLSLSSFFNSYKIGIVKDADILSSEAQNALLKTLEEPRPKVVIILLVEEISSLLATIASRSQILYFYPVSTASVYDYLLATTDINRSLAKELSAASLGRPLQAKQWAENPTAYRERSDLVRSLFDFLKAGLTDRLTFINQIGSGGIISVEAAEQWLDVLESLWRDALLVSLNQENRLQYSSLLPEWPSLLGERVELAGSAILDRLQKIRQARAYLLAFVNPKNVLESLAIYF